MLPKHKVPITVEIEADQKEWLEEIVKKHEMPDTSKAMRVLLDFALTFDDEDRIFEKVRCFRC